MARKAISKETSVNILTKSRRRCALCFALSWDFGEKKGQIAHIDQDSSNNNEDNLAFLCLEHHDQYDSKTSQSKGITVDELKSYLNHLYSAVETGLETNLSHKQKVLAHDEENFKIANKILSEEHLISFLDMLQTDDSYSDKGKRPLLDFCFYFDETGNYYLSPQLESGTKLLVKSLTSLLSFLAYNFFVYPNKQSFSEDRWFALYPDLNIDRNGNGSYEQMKRYEKAQNELDLKCEDVRKSYKEYRIKVKQVLFC